MDVIAKINENNEIKNGYATSAIPFTNIKFSVNHRNAPDIDIEYIQSQLKDRFKPYNQFGNHDPS